MKVLKHLIALFILIVQLAVIICGSQCPLAEIYTNSWEKSHQKIKTHCAVGNQQLIVTLKPSHFIKFKCIRTQNAWEFPQIVNQSLAAVKSITVHGCRSTNSSDETIRSLVSFLTIDGVKNVKKFNLPENNLKKISSGFLSDFQGLQLLDLSHNKLEDFPDDLCHLSSLKILDVQNNELKTIKSFVFEKMKKLRYLNLSDNKIVKIQSKAFDHSTALESLSIASNSLSEVPDKLFDKLRNLKFLNLSKNNFTESALQNMTLQNNTNLEKFVLTGNFQNLSHFPAEFFENLTKLTTINIANNGITELSENFIKSLINLKEFNVESNFLEMCPPAFFSNCPKIKVINIKFNRLIFLPLEAFPDLKELEELDLSHNRLQDIDYIMRGLISLKYLNLGFNRLRRIEQYEIEPLKNLTELNMEHNRVSKLTYHHVWDLDKRLKIFNLRHNNIKSLRIKDINWLFENLTIDLSYNKIKTISLRGVKPHENVVKNDGKINVILTNNPITCDRNVYELLLYRENRGDPYIRRHFDLDTTGLKCHKPQIMANVSMEDFEASSFKCFIETPKKYGGECPADCDCWLRPEDKAYLVDCTNRHLKLAPRSLKCPKGHFIELNLTGNELTKMPAMNNQPGYDAVEVISLSDNNIDDLPPNALSVKLRYLDLSSNNLTRLELPIVKHLNTSMKLEKFMIDHNPWTCNCSAIEFYRFIKGHVTQMPELKEVTCENTDLQLYRMTLDGLCPQPTNWIVIASMVVAVIGLINGIVASLYHNYQNEIKVWLFAHQWCLRLITEEELDKDKEFDAFVSYSHKDEAFVIHSLIPELENGPKPFKLCIHYRDFIVGESIATQIVRSIENSRRTIIVLSPNFLESEWSRMEFRTAHAQALNEGRTRVIVIIYDDVGPVDGLDAELRAYLNTNTYIKWGDPWFWRKLKYALPHSEDVIGTERKRIVSEYPTSTIQCFNDDNNKI